MLRLLSDDPVVLMIPIATLAWFPSQGLRINNKSSANPYCCIISGSFDYIASWVHFLADDYKQNGSKMSLLYMISYHSGVRNYPTVSE